MSVECIRDCVCVCCVHIPGLCQIYKITQINQSENKTKSFEKIQKSNLALKIFKFFLASYCSQNLVMRDNFACVTPKYLKVERMVSW